MSLNGGKAVTQFLVTRAFTSLSCYVSKHNTCGWALFSQIGLHNLGFFCSCEQQSMSSSPCSVAPCSAGFWFLGLDLCWWQGQGASAGWICLCHSWAALKPDRGGCSWRLIRLYHRCMIPGILTWWFIGSFFSGNWITLVVCAALSLSGSDLLHLLC